MADVLPAMEGGNAGVVGNIRRHYTATIPYIASDAQPLRLHAQCRSAEQSMLCRTHRFTHVDQSTKDTAGEETYWFMSAFC
jgi:hypothetical protein